MNKTERLAIWTEIKARVEARLTSFKTDYPNADAIVTASIRNYDQDMVKQAVGYIELYS